MKSFPVALLVVAAFPLAGASAGDITVDAYNGQPFGVGVVTFNAGWHPDDKVKHVDDHGSQQRLLQLGDHAFYPVSERRGIADFKTSRGTEWVTYFLFKPGENVTVNPGFVGKAKTVATKELPDQYRKTLDRWWALYSSRAKQSALAERYPPEVDQYLTSMLSRRLGQRHVSINGKSYLNFYPGATSIALMAGTESIRLAMQKDALLKKKGDAPIANQPLPKAVSPPPVAIPDVEGFVEIEPLAMVVPHECFYMRFGNYANFSWFRDSLEEWGTDLRNVVSLRAIDYHLTDRLQEQLQVSENELSRLLGPAMIRDVALIGTDTFLREGAGMGVIFHAAKSSVLQAQLQMQRRACVSSLPNVTLKPVSFEGHTVEASLLSSTDNRIRSFYVRHDDFHLVTTSRYIARRFLEAAQKQKDALGLTAEFRYSRSKTRANNEDSTFIYLSDAFFRTLVEPSFRVEMTRRARSENELQLIQFAQLAAQAEQQPSGSIDDLIKGRFLPVGFGQRWDGTKIEFQNGEPIDSIRGRRGSFLPVRDVEITQVTTEEAEGYQLFSAEYRRLWRMMDPATISLNRRNENGRERLIMDLNIFPFPTSAYGGFAWFSRKKTQTEFSLPKQATLLIEGGILGIHPVFLGIHNSPIPYTVDSDGRVQTNMFQSNSWPWFGGTGQDSILRSQFGVSEFPNKQFVPSKPGIQPGMVGYRRDELTFIGRDEDSLRRVVDGLHVREAEREAQLRLHVGDLANSELVKLMHVQADSVAKRMTRGNAEYLNRLTSQLHVPQASALEIAERLLQGNMVCLLGGKYELRPVATKSDDKRIWSSTRRPAWTEYKLPLLTRIRGAEFELTLDRTTLTTHVELLMDNPTAEAKRTLNSSPPANRSIAADD